eukprot:CAMPEP_0115461008 /NCGR_PEP_ID=MMETSP0271-20121206/47084_1 /TAXON_ID=71861 /ORGANISM="Scrippsiella trochoidea, Strain CCMP3099" /LENGTH=70 /DNA_ID=CAMNT_0002887745 /DNA_START=17 /DNA_END=226 /DNA_ORIENTATION=+
MTSLRSTSTAGKTSCEPHRHRRHTLMNHGMYPRWSGVALAASAAATALPPLRLLRLPSLCSLISGPLKRA